MSVPLDISLISQLLNEQIKVGADLNTLTKPGFFYVTYPTNTPNNMQHWCHVINLVNYISSQHIDKYRRIYQMFISDARSDTTIWFRIYSEGWSDWERIATATDLPNSTTNNPSQGE